MEKELLVIKNDSEDDSSQSCDISQVKDLRNLIMDKRLTEAFILANKCKWAKPIRHCLKSRLLSSVELGEIVQAADALIKDNKVHVAWGLLKVIVAHPAFDEIVPQMKDMCVDAFCNMNMSIAGKYPVAM